MNTDEARNILTQIFNAPYEEADIQLCLGSAGNDDEVPVIEKVQISVDVSNEFKLITAREVRRYRKKSLAGDLRLLKYDPAAMNRADEIEYLPLAEEESITSQIANLNDIQALPVFTASEEFVGELRFYALVLETDDKRSVALRFYSPSSELSRSTYFGVRLSDTVFNKIEEPAFLFDAHLDCIISEDVVFIFNKNNFQRIFRYYERVVAAAKAALNTVSSRVKIENFSAFSALCEGNLNMMAKLKNLASKEYLQSVTMKDIKRVIKSFGLAATVIRKDGEDRLVFDPDSKDKWLILRILDDDFLGSVMTKLKYEANSKRALP